MKFETAKRNISGSEPLENTAIKIAANAKAFTLLFKSIYPNIEKALVRELITNAWDGHQVRGNLDVPFDVHVPSVLEPWFSVRDFGISMTHEVVTQVYSTVFESLKDESNDVAGMFGMGSKSPLGYTDSFSLQTWVDGKTRIYDVFLNSQGAPQISLQYEEESDEEQGVLVTVPVKLEDIAKIRDNVFSMINQLNTPVTLNGTLFEKKEYEVFLQNEDFVLYKHDSSLGLKNQARIRMGCVTYPIRHDLFHAAKNFGFETAYIFNYPFELIFPIGTFQVTGSREDIIYTDAGNKKIIDAIKNIQEKLAEHIKNDVAAIRNKTKRNIVLANIQHFWGNFVSDKTIYALKKQERHPLRIDYTKIASIRYVSFDRLSFKVQHVKRQPAKVMFVVGTKSKKVGQRLNDYIDAYIDTIDPKVPTDHRFSSATNIIVTTDLPNTFSMRKLWDIYGEPEIIDLDKVAPYVRPKPVKRVPVSSLELCRYGGKTLENVDLTKDVYYIRKSKQDTAFQKHGLIGAFKKSTYNKDDKILKNIIYNIPDSKHDWVMKKFGATTKFINVEDLILDEIKGTGLDKFNEDLFRYKSLEEKFYYSSDLLMTNALLSKFNLKKLSDNEIRDMKQNADLLSSLDVIYGFEKSKEAAARKLNKEITEIENRYPMLHPWIRGYSHYGFKDPKMIENYINLVDEMEKVNAV